jgi:hypothetical protein
MSNRVIIPLLGALAPLPGVILHPPVQAGRSAARRPFRVLALLAALCASLPLAPAAAQTLYAGAGVGPTPVLEGAGGNRNWFGMVGYQGPQAFGGRLSGAETASRLWLSADLTYQPGRPTRVVRPYGVLGVGMALDLNETDAIFTTGAGLRIRLRRLMFVFVEARLQAIPGSPQSGPSAIVPLTFGLGVGH